MATDYLNTAESIAGQAPDSDFLLNLLHRVDREQLAKLSSSDVESLFSPPSPVLSNTRKLDIEMLGGFTLRNINGDDDMNRAVHILQSLKLSLESMAKLLTGPNSTPIASAPQIAAG